MPDKDNHNFFISYDPEPNYKENFRKGFRFRIKNVFRYMIGVPGGIYVGFLGVIFNSLRNTNARYAVSIPVGIILFPIYLTLILLGFALGSVYSLVESFIFPFTYLFAAIKDLIEAKTDDFTFQSVSRSEIKVNYRFKNHIFHHPFKAIESHINTLDLSSNELGAKPIAEVIALLKSIPLSIRHLKLANNGLDKGIVEEDLRQIYLALPRHLESLDLSQNQFSKADVITALPDKLRTLKLNRCHIGGNELSSILPLLPASLTSLEVKENPKILTHFTSPQGTLACKNLKLDISSNEFKTDNQRPPYKSLEWHCENFLSKLPNEVIALNFKYSNFLEIISANVEFPKHLTELGLGASILTVNERRVSLGGLSQLKVIKFDLSPNGYMYRIYRQGVKYTPKRLSFEHIPQMVNELDLSHNYLGALNEHELISLLSTIPGHIRIIHLDHNGLFHGKTITEADALFQKIQAALTSMYDPAKPPKLTADTPMIHLSNGNGYPVASQFGLLLTPPLKLMCFKLPTEHRQASLQQIPKSVTTLDLSNNQLGQLEAQAILELLGHIPEHVRVVILDNNELFNNKTPVEAEALYNSILSALPSHPTLGKPALYLGKGNGRSVYTTPRAEPKSSLEFLPYQARNLIYEFLGGQETLEEVEVRQSCARL